jgi:hypothetical protein
MKKQKIKMSDLLNCYEGISMLVEKNVDFDVELGFDLAVSRANMQTHIDAYNGQRQKLLDKFGTAKGNNQFTIADEYLEEFNKQVEALASKEVEVELFEGKISRADLNGSKMPIRFAEVFKPFMKT